MIAELDLLRQLQDVDSALDREAKRYAEIQGLLADTSELEAAQQRRDECRAALGRLEADQRDLELKIESERTHLEQVEKKLYGGRVGDAKELNNLHRDAVQVKARVGTLEDRLLELFVAAEEASVNLTAAQSALDEVERRHQQRHAELSAERDRLDGAIGADRTRQAALRERIDPAILRGYDNLRRTRGGLAVAEVRQRTCTGCRVGLTAAEEQRVRRGESLIHCQSCGRILVAAG